MISGVSLTYVSLENLGLLNYAIKFMVDQLDIKALNQLHIDNSVHIT